MAEPWTDDLAALGERSKHHLRSLDATRARLLATSKEPKMRLFRHPVFAALIAVLVLGIAAPLAYALVDRVFLSIDADKSAPEIEHDINQQLHDQGIAGSATAHKSDDGIVHVEIESPDQNLGAKLQVATPGGSAARSYRIEIDCPDEAHCEHLHDATTNQDIINVLVNAGALSDDELAAAIRAHLEAYDVDVTVHDGVVTIRCRR